MKQRLWAVNFDERQLKEIEFSEMYAENFQHGTDGHNAKLIIARMAKVLDGLEAEEIEYQRRSEHKEA